MKILFDTNIILDALLERQPFINQARDLLSLVEQGSIEGLMCATTVTTIFYLATKIIGKKAADNVIHSLLQLFDIAPVNRIILENALKNNFSDFEDAVLHEAAIHSGAHAIVTRDIKGFKKASLTIYTPHELLSIEQKHG